MVSITRLFEFEAAHFLPEHPGKCRNLHGHSYKLEVEVEGRIGNNGMVMDFGILKSIVNKELIDKMDHTNLNEAYDNPTAEEMVWSMFHILSLKINAGDTRVKRMRLWETSNCYVEVKI